MPLPPRSDHQSSDLENFTTTNLPEDIIAQIIPFLPVDEEHLALTSLSDEILEKIISFLPELPREATAHKLKKVYDSLSLACLHPRCRHLFTQRTSVVKYIDPFPGIPHTERAAHLPPYAQPPFLSLLVSICPKLYSLRAPSVRRVLKFAGGHLKELSFIDDGLAFEDLFFLSKSSLTIVSVTNPSAAVLTALADVKTLKRVSLLKISPSVVSSVITFFGCTTAKCLLLDLNSTGDQDLYFLLHRLPSLQTFALQCDARHAWSVLKQLRVVALNIGSVYLIVQGVQITVQKIASSGSDAGVWEATVMQKLMSLKDFRTNQRSQLWPRGMHLKKIDLELFEEVNLCGAHQRILEHHFSQFFDTAPSGPEIIVRLGRKVPSLAQANMRSEWITKTSATARAKTLVISQDIVRHALASSTHWLHKFLTTVMSNFTVISTLHLCKSLRDGKVSGRFVMALPDFLKTVTHNCPLLQAIYLEDAGELVLQTVGMPVLSDEKKLKVLLQSVIAYVEKIEKTSEVEMGTIIAQLKTWASNKLRVDASVLINEAVP